MAGLSTHVLDTAAGVPARGLELVLYRVFAHGRSQVGAFTTNHDGRCDAPLLTAEALAPGTYEIDFLVGAWRQASGAPAGFYDVVPVRFVVDDTSRHYHVPLLLAPYGYSTYRGS